MVSFSLTKVNKESVGQNERKMKIFHGLLVSTFFIRCLASFKTKL